MYVVTVQFDIYAEHVAAFREQMRLQAANSLALEVACRQFDVCYDPESNVRCFLFEKYDDRAAFDLHLISDHFKQFDANVASWIKQKTVETWEQED